MSGSFQLAPTSAYPTMPTKPAKVLGQSKVTARPVPIAAEVPVETAGPLAVGSEIPSVPLDCGFPPTKVNLAERTKGKRVIVVGLPGAFTPT
jgi:hypothetical protein